MFARARRSFPVERPSRRAEISRAPSRTQQTTQPLEIGDRAFNSCLFVETDKVSSNKTARVSIQEGDTLETAKIVVVE